MELASMAAALEASGEYRVLRRLPLELPQILARPTGQTLRQGLFVDVETTGLDPMRDEIIELAMVPFVYGAEDGCIFEIKEAFHGLQQPSTAIPAHITKLTGINDAMVAGKTIDADTVKNFIASSSLIIAHNAAFDRKFLERFCDAFTSKPWACSYSQVDWSAEEIEGGKLSYLATAAGFFFDGHRATHDCIAAIHILAQTLPKTRVTALQRLLEQARSISYRIWAEDAPYDLKDRLRERGYRWNREGNDKPRAWYLDVTSEQHDAEILFLQNEIYRTNVDLPTIRVDAYNRFSERV